MFERILVANRGEIACRILRSAHAMGYATVAVFSTADADAPHVRLADEAWCLGEGPAASSYLAIDRLMEACRQTGADALHPGYGFLSENAELARACQAQGVRFIGPSVASITMMASKRLARQAMLQAGVPCIPGYEGANQSDERLAQEAARIGYPVMVKASAGGGGRGMRRVDDPQDLQSSLQTARSEAGKAFGSEELILEKALLAARHIEIQIFADEHGTAIHLGERDCSLQRRHQKVIEEAPSPFVDSDLRERMGQAAIAVALACRYSGAGTVEFLVGQSGEFYFLEMNTRLQVEHPVTEAITGLDLVRLQLEVASGQPLSLDQSRVVFNGHAIEARIYAEDPNRDFMAQSGRIEEWAVPALPGIRVDAGIRSGQQLSPYYDAMVAKIIAWGENRSTALRRLQRALALTRFSGVPSNLYFLRSLLATDTFREGQATTDYIESRFLKDGTAIAPVAEAEDWALAAVLFALLPGPSDASRRERGRTPRHAAPQQGSSIPVMPLRLCSGTQTLGLTLEREERPGAMNSVWQVRRLPDLADSAQDKPPAAAAVQSQRARTLPVQPDHARQPEQSVRPEQAVQPAQAEPPAAQAREPGPAGGWVHTLAVEALREEGVEDQQVDRADQAHTRTGELTFRSGERLLRVRYCMTPQQCVLYTRRGPLNFEDLTRVLPKTSSDRQETRIHAPMDGAIMAVHVQPGDRVSRGQVVLTLEAMKMEHPLRAGLDGVLASVDVTPGTQVRVRQVLAEIGPLTDPEQS